MRKRMPALAVLVALALVLHVACRRASEEPTPPAAGPRLKDAAVGFVQSLVKEDYANAVRPHAQELSIKERKGSFAEVEPCMPGEVIREECKRCLRCDLEWLQTFSLPLEAKPDRLATEAELTILKK